MSEHPSDSISNRLAWPGKHTSQKKHITRLKDDKVCDKKISDDLVYLTKDTSSVSILSELEEREEIAEDVPAPADIPAPAPADTLETVEEQPYTPGSRKSTKKNLGRPASTSSDFYM